jgi:iron-sulfur cluster assembly accessory protein
MTVSLSKAAQLEFLRLKAKYPPDHVLHINVESGGCKDYYYNFAFAVPSTETVAVLHLATLEIVTPAEVAPLIDGLSIDYSEDLMGGGFRFQNPNASDTCGCSNSFSMASS